MNCEIVSKDRWRGFLTGSLTSKEIIELRDHFEAGCPSCEVYFETLDEETEEDLLAAIYELKSTSTQTFEINERQSFQSVIDRVRKEKAHRGQRRAWKVMVPRPLVWGVGLAAVLVLLLGGLLLRITPLNPLQREKGWSQLDPPKLEFAVGTINQTGKVLVQRGMLGGTYMSSEELFLKVEPPQEGFVHLLIFQEELLVFSEVIDTSRGSSQQRLEIGLNGSVIDIPLKGLSGTYKAVAVSSPSRFNIQDELFPLVRMALAKESDPFHTQFLETSQGGVVMEHIFFNVNP